MKGLLLKDWYSIKSYMRIFLWLSAVFILAPIAMEGNTFLIYYPCLFPGMMTISLIAYEEKEHWDAYAMTLPYTRKQAVSAKYLVSLLSSSVIFISIFLVQLSIMLYNHRIDLSFLGTLLCALIPVALIPPSFLIPFVYRFGSEKARMAYYVVLAIGCTVIGLMGGFSGEGLSTLEKLDFGVWLPLGTIVLFVLSWRLSIHLYSKRAF